MTFKYGTHIAIWHFIYVPLCQKSSQYPQIPKYFRRNHLKNKKLVFGLMVHLVQHHVSSSGQYRQCCRTHLRGKQ